MMDPRIPEYRSAALTMAKGLFSVAIPIGQPDEVGKLGEALVQLRTAMDRKFQEQRRLSQITEQVNRGSILTEVLELIHSSFQQILPYDRIGCALLEDDGFSLRAIWARTQARASAIPVGYTARIEGSSLLEILDSGKPRVINDLEAYLRDHPASDSTRRIVAEGVRSSLTCPLIAVGKPLGFLFFSSNAPAAYADAHVETYCQLAGNLSTIIEKARLYEQILEERQKVESANRKLERLAFLDDLTGLPNRRYFSDYFDRARRNMRRSRRALSLAMIDVDHFKLFNDTYGHPAGDACLERVGRAIRDGLRRGSDFVARYGGEEFIVVLNDTNSATAAALAEALRAAVLALHIPNASVPTGELTVSIGVSTGVSGPSLTGTRLIELADEALYQAKRDGRNRVCLREEGS